jgi:hypothetical protein
MLGGGTGCSTSPDRSEKPFLGGELARPTSWGFPNFAHSGRDAAPLLTKAVGSILRM